MTYPRFAALTLPIVAAALALFIFMHFTRAEERRDPKRAFEAVYEEAAWGRARGTGTSGSGSTPRVTMLYRMYLAQFFKDHTIKSVVDAGCGDWEFSQRIDWSGIDYKGFDIVANVIEANQRFAKSNVQFFIGNVVDDDLPAADLLLVKHVLQHLPNADVQRFIDRQLKKYKHVLITNGVDELMTAHNDDIAVGEYRPLDITQPPFALRGTKELTWFGNGHMHQVVHVDNTTGR